MSASPTLSLWFCPSLSPAGEALPGSLGGGQRVLLSAGGLLSAPPGLAQRARGMALAWWLGALRRLHLLAQKCA